MVLLFQNGLTNSLPRAIDHLRIVIFTAATLSILLLSSSVITSTRLVLPEAHGANGPDFSLASNPSSLMIGLGSSGTAAITVTSMNSFSGIVTLTDEITPQGPTISLSQQSVSISAGASQTSTLTVSTVGASPFTSVGSFTINVTGVSNGSSGTTRHSLMVALTVSSPSSGRGDFLSLLSLGLFGVAVVLLVYLARRRATKN